MIDAKRLASVLDSIDLDEFDTVGEFDSRGYAEAIKTAYETVAADRQERALRHRSAYGHQSLAELRTPDGDVFMAVGDSPEEAAAELAAMLGSTSRLPR